MIIDFHKYKSLRIKEEPETDLARLYVQESLPMDSTSQDLLINTIAPFVQAHGLDLIDIFIDSLVGLPLVNNAIPYKDVAELVLRLRGLKDKL